MNPRQMNPRQRQGLLLVMIAAVGLIGVFLLIAAYVSSVSKQVGPKVDVLTLRRPIQPFQQVNENDLGVAAVPKKWLPGTALLYPSEALGQISQVSLPAGTELEQGMLTAPPVLQPGEREFAMSVDQVSGVANQVQEGSTVDILATFASGSNSQAASARVVVPDVKVLLTEQSTSATGGGVVTLALTPDQVQKVAYAESFAQKVSLSLVAPGTNGTTSQPAPYAPPGL